MSKNPNAVMPPQSKRQYLKLANRVTASLHCASYRPRTGHVLWAYKQAACRGRSCTCQRIHQELCRLGVVNAVRDCRLHGSKPEPCSAWPECAHQLQCSAVCSK